MAEDPKERKGARADIYGIFSLGIDLPSFGSLYLKEGLTIIPKTSALAPKSIGGDDGPDASHHSHQARQDDREHDDGVDGSTL
jgi:hypothetical protein